MSIVVLRKPENVLSGTTEQVVIGDATRTIDSLQRDADGAVQDITGWTASIVGHSDDLPGVFFDVPGEIVAPASAGVFRWTRVGDFLTQIGEKSRARFTCQVRTVDAAGAPAYGAEFGLDFVLDGTGEDTNMNAAAVQALIDNAEGHPFEFPLAGTMKTGYPIVGVPLTNGQSATVFSASGDGIVRNFAWIVTASLVDGITAAIPDLSVQIFYDGSATPSVSLPIHTLAGLEYPEFAITDLMVSTPAFELSAGPNASAFPGIVAGQSGNWRLPIPFTNGIEIKIVAGASATKHIVYCNTMYQDVLPACWNRTFRLFASRSNETLSAASANGQQAKLTSNTQIEAVTGSFATTVVGKSIVINGACYSDMLILSRPDSTHLVVSSKDVVGSVPVLNTAGELNLMPAHTFLTRPAGESGYIAVVVGGCIQDGGDVDMLFEGNVRFFLGAETEPTLEWSSVEDFAMGSFYFEQRSRLEEGGITAKDSFGNSAFSIYKVFFKEPVKYTDGIRCTVPQYSSFGASTFNWTTFYYKVMG